MSATVVGDVAQSLTPCIPLSVLQSFAKETAEICPAAWQLQATKPGPLVPNPVPSFLVPRSPKALDTNRHFGRGADEGAGEGAGERALGPAEAGVWLDADRSLWTRRGFEGRAAAFVRP